MATELLKGHSLAVVKGNIGRLTQAGKSESEARAISFRQARKSLAARLAEGVEVFRAGSYPGKVPVTERDLHAIATTYNEHQAGKGPRYEAAAKLTHESGRPAESWVSGLRADGRSLVASFRDASDDLLNGIIEERYPNPSVELRQSFQVDGKDQGLSLKAVAFLGADPPAVKDVAAFSADEDGELVIAFTFSEWSSQPGGTTVQDKDDGGTPTLKLQVQAVPPDKTDPKTGGTSFSEDELNAAVEKAVKKASAEAADAARKEAEMKFAEQQAAAAEKARQASNLAFCDGLVASKKLAPADRDFWTGMLNALAPDLNFGEGAAAKPIADELKARMTAMPVSPLFREVTPPGQKGMPTEGLRFSEATQTTLDEIEARYEGGKDSKPYKAALAAAQDALQRGGA